MLHYWIRDIFIRYINCLSLKNYVDFKFSPCSDYWYTSTSTTLDTSVQITEVKMTQSHFTETSTVQNLFTVPYRVHYKQLFHSLCKNLVILKSLVVPCLKECSSAPYLSFRVMNKFIVWLDNWSQYSAWVWGRDYNNHNSLLCFILAWKG